MIVLPRSLDVNELADVELAYVAYVAAGFQTPLISRV